MHPNIKPLAALLPLFNFLPVAAQTSADMQPVVVTATRQAMRADELLADVTVIDRAQIEQAGAASLVDVLGRQPGVQFTANGGPGASTSLFIRGAEARHTLVLVDGLRVSSATTGQSTLENIPLTEIERIEILRGPASALYGSEAIGGVVQIFTRRGQGTPRFTANAGFGTWNTWQAGAGVSGEVSGWRFNLHANRYDTEGFSAIRDPRKQANYHPDRDSFRQNAVSASLSRRVGNLGEAGLSLLHADGRSEYDNGPGAYSSYLDKTLDTYQAFLNARLMGAWSARFSLGRSTDYSVDRASAASRSTFRTDTDQFIWQNDFRLPVGQALLAYEYSRQQVGGTTAYVVDSRTVNSLLAGWTASIGQHRLQLNARHDDNSQFGAKTTGSVAYGYQFTPAWRANIAYGTAFNAPTFNQLYWPNTGFGGGNPNLKPEEARNGEAGLTWEQAGQRVSLVVFRNRVTNLIAGWPPVNVNHARIDGATLSYAGEFGPWSISASIDSLNPRDDQTGRLLPRRAKEQANVRLAYRTGGWLFGSELQGVGTRYDDTANARRMGGYGLLNLFANYRLAPDWQLEARVNNVGDKQYETAWGYGTLGINGFLGVRYTPK